MITDKINPFSPGAIVKSALFGGRHEYIINILKRLVGVKNARPASFYLFGERGIGKTALAKLISYIASSKNKELFELNFIVSYYSVQLRQSFNDVLESSLNNIADQIDETILKKIGSRLGGIFKDGKFSIGAFGFEASFNGGRKNDYTSERAIIKDQVVSILRNIIYQIRNADDRSKNKDGILIIIDEMDNLEDINLAASIIRGITTELDFEDIGFVSFLLIGYENGYETFISGDESIRRLIDPIHLIEMPENEIIETFEKGFRETSVNWDKETLKEKVWLTGGYPLAIQVIGYYLIEYDIDNSIEEDDWNKSVKKGAEELIDKEYSSYYTFTKKQKKNTDRILLSLAIASMNKLNSLSLKEIERISEVINPRQYLTQLMKNGVVSKDKMTGEYIIKKGLLRTAIILDLFKVYPPEEASSKFSRMITKSQEIYTNKQIHG